MDIGQLEIREFLDDFLRGQPGSQKIQDVADAYSHPTDTRATATLLWVDSDSLIEECHDVNSKRTSGSRLWLPPMIIHRIVRDDDVPNRASCIPGSGLFVVAFQ